MDCSGSATISRGGYRKWLGRILRDRQILVRAGGRFYAIRLGRTLQVALLCSAAAAGTWMAFASSEYFVQKRSLVVRDFQVSSARAAYDDVLSDLARRQSEVDALTAEVARLNQLQERGRRAVQYQSERAARFVADWEKVIARTGLDTEDFLAASGDGPKASGGPFLPASGEDATPLPLAADLANFEETLDELARMRHAVSRLPLTVPLDSYAISSGFGRRRDPINKRLARHEGLDLIAPLKSPIYATAPGVVTMAGRYGRYGNFIEIDHGAGLKTRFGHLAKIFVRRGQKVAFRHKIALLGNSGRSTGAHLHYEVRVDGNPTNPMKFIEAGRYVFQNQ
jgi:murein DD-endopeptidase MepM/ murein hydrolase activator NlpD